jgi:hypothetical protein
MWLQCKCDFVLVSGKDLPTKMLIYKWYKMFDQTGCIHKGRVHGRIAVAEAQLDTVCVAFIHSPCKSTRHAAWHLNMPQTTVHKILLKHFKFWSCKHQLLQHVNVQGRYIQCTFCSDLLASLGHEAFTAKIVCSDKATFHLWRSVNKHNLIIWGGTISHEVTE